MEGIPLPCQVFQNTKVLPDGTLWCDTAGATSSLEHENIGFAGFVQVIRARISRAYIMYGFADAVVADGGFPAFAALGL